MQKYCAFLGHQPHISVAELAAILPDFLLSQQWDQRIITFQTARKLDTEWLRTVGGTVLIAEELKQSESRESIEKLVQRVLLDAVRDTGIYDAQGGKRKVTFSFRCFGVPHSTIRNLYRSCKKTLRDKNIPSRYIGNERHPAKPGTLLLRGIPGPRSIELVLLQAPPTRGKKKSEQPALWIGRTCAVQDIEAYTMRDMGKPFRDTKTGLLPPKVAQIMLNLAMITFPQPLREHLAKQEGKWEGITIWDPFCGSGVILLEALLRRAHVLGSDLTERAVRGCTENIRWIRQKEKTPKIITSTIFKQNATKTFDLPRTPTVLVTETSLGPALTEPPTKRDIVNLLRQAEELEQKFFQNAATLVPDTPIICSFPVYVSRDGTKHRLEKILPLTEKLGYRRTSIQTPFHQTDTRQSLLYLRPDQYVGREIFCFLPPGTATQTTAQKSSEHVTSAQQKKPKKIVQQNQKLKKK